MRPEIPKVGESSKPVTYPVGIWRSERIIWEENKEALEKLSQMHIIKRGAERRNEMFEPRYPFLSVLA